MIAYFLLLVVVALVQVVNTHESIPVSCNSPIYCEGPLLKTVQLARLYDDSKTFVDMPTSKPVEQVLEGFKALGDHPGKEEIRQFVSSHFAPVASEMKPYNITTSGPLAWSDKVDDAKYRGWAEVLHQSWARLAFQFDTSSLCDGCVSSTLPVKRPFVVPGGRFREFYYWDSYFVIEGLLQSGLNSLALDMIENFLDFVDTYGFMPNGARIYYLNRSQPPFLTEMVNLYFQKTKDVDFLKKALPVLDKEYKFWRTNTTVTIRHNDRKYKLNRFNVENHSPRPESYVEDYNLVHHSPQALTPKQQSDLFSDLATGAESGWDYSSRWTKQHQDGADLLRSLNTRHVVPVELNALLWSMETYLADWYETYGADLTTDKQRRRKTTYYRKQAHQRLDAMDTLLWNDTSAQFFDYNLTSHAQTLQFSAAALVPFWLGAVPARARTPAALHRVFDTTHALLRQNPGILTSTAVPTSMQWDFPNGWPPLQYVAIHAMRVVDAWLDKDRYEGLAKVLAQRMAASAYCSWYLTGGSLPDAGLTKLANTADNGHMFEKFDVRSLTDSGFGGEYTVQVGFGWTNGVALWILNNYNDLVAPDCTSNNIYPVPDLN